MSIDTKKTYEHAEMPGVAWIVRGPEVEHMGAEECPGHADDDFALMCGGLGESYFCDGSCVEPQPTGMVRAVMVGDDRVHIVDPDDLTEIDEDDYCSGCGQIGCGHG